MKDSYRSITGIPVVPATPTEANASMTLGIIAVALSLTSPLIAALVSPIVFVLGTVAIILAVIYRRKVSGDPKAVRSNRAMAGLILGVVAITVSTLALLFQVVIWSSRLDMVSTLTVPV